MKKRLKSIPQAFRITFEKRDYIALGIFFSLFFILLYISIPVVTVSGNSYEFFISSTPILELGFITVISILMGIVTTMQIYAWKNGQKSKANAALGTTGFFSGAMAGIFSTATCASCVSVVFGFLGFGGVLFLIEKRIEILTISAVIMLVAFYFTSQRIADGCKSCKI